MFIRSDAGSNCGIRHGHIYILADRVVTENRVATKKPFTPFRAKFFGRQASLFQQDAENGQTHCSLKFAGRGVYSCREEFSDMGVLIEGPWAPELPDVWNKAPQESSPDFFRTFRAISLAVQKCLRERVPPVFLADARIFEEPNLVYPMLMYSASRPFRPAAWIDLTYDPIDASWFIHFAKTSERGLAPRLRAVYDRLQREQAGDVSLPYGPRRAAKAIRAVRKYRQSQVLLSRLVAGEAALVADLERLAGLGALEPRERKECEARFFRNFRTHLKRMCPRCDLTPLAPVVLQAATEALDRALQAAAREEAA